MRCEYQIMFLSIWVFDRVEKPRDEDSVCNGLVNHGTEMGLKYQELGTLEQVSWCEPNRYQQWIQWDHSWCPVCRSEHTGGPGDKPHSPPLLLPVGVMLVILLPDTSWTSTRLEPLLLGNVPVTDMTADEGWGVFGRENLVPVMGWSSCRGRRNDGAAKVILSTGSDLMAGSNWKPGVEPQLLMHAGYLQSGWQQESTDGSFDAWQVSAHHKTPRTRHDNTLFTRVEVERRSSSVWRQLMQRPECKGKHTQCYILPALQRVVVSNSRLRTWSIEWSRRTPESPDEAFTDCPTLGFQSQSTFVMNTCSYFIYIVCDKKNWGGVGRQTQVYWQ